VRQRQNTFDEILFVATGIHRRQAKSLMHEVDKRESRWRSSPMSGCEPPPANAVFTVSAFFEDRRSSH
jgi:hypothetical protein